MHFKILIEDQSGKRCLDRLMPMLVNDNHTYDIHPYSGVGRIPSKQTSAADVKHCQLLNDLPRLIGGFGKTFAGYGTDYEACVVVICDLDDKSFPRFMAELEGLVAKSNPTPNTRFCIAIEEGEAWFLGDIPAIKAAYPKAKEAVLNAYVNDSICGTWETLANAVYPGGAGALKKQGSQAAGAEKSVWAEKITPHMNVDANRSPSFQHFRDTIRQLAP